MKKIIYGIPGYEKLSQAIATKLKAKIGQVEIRAFPDGERYLRFLNSLQGSDVAVVGGTVSDSALVDLYDFASGAVSLGCHRISFVIPFFGYSTMERAVKPGEVVTAKNRARLLSSVPKAPQGNRVFLLDLHSEGIPYYFEAGYLPEHIYAKSLVMEAARKVGGKNFILASVDAGRAKWVESLANELGVEARFILKKRSSDRATSVMAVSGAVQGKKVVIYDDMIRTGGSLMSAARAYLEQGALDVTAIATHGLFPDDSLEKIKKSGTIRQVICTDSHPRARILEVSHRGFFKVISVASLLASALKDHP